MTLAQYEMLMAVVDNGSFTKAAEGLGCSMRIPMEDEHDEVKAKLKVPPTYMIPAFIGIGYADPREELPEQNRADLAKQVHYGRWK